MKLVILDRDGVINYDSSNYIKNADEWIPIPGSLESIAKLNKNGFKVVIASNQGGIGKGLFDVNALSSINKKISNELLTLYFDKLLHIKVNFEKDHIFFKFGKLQTTLSHTQVNRFKIFFDRIDPCGMLNIIEI